MAHITAKNSVWISSTVGYAFSGTGPDTLIVDADAFLITSFSGFYDAVRLYDEWTVVINGSVAGLAGSAEGIALIETNSNDTTLSHITVGKTGEVFGDDAGILAFYDAGDHVTIKNFGMISGNGNSIRSLAAATISNGGTLLGNVLLSDGHDVFKDFVKTGTVVHNGIINGTVDLAAGDDSFIGGAHGESVKDAEGADHYDLGGGNDTYFAINVGSDGLDDVIGGSGSDTYDAGDATNGLAIILDGNIHFGIGGHSAGGTDIGGVDKVTGFENAIGGINDDLLVGSKAANQLFAGGGADTIEGLGGSDMLSGNVGADIFLYEKLSDSGPTAAARDFILDFAVGEDLIDLAAIDANGGALGEGAFDFIVFDHFSGTRGELREAFSKGNTIVSGDVNGDGKPDFSIALAGHIVLSDTDFSL